MPSVEELLEYFRSYPFPSPQALDQFMRATLSDAPRRLFLSPFAFPVFIANPPSYTPAVNAAITSVNLSYIDILKHYHDRAPLFVHGGFAQTFGTHGLTSRMNYTVPANRKAFCEVLEIDLIRYAVDGVGAGLALGQIRLNNGAGGGGVLTARFLNNTLGYQVYSVVGMSALLLPGDVLEFFTLLTDATIGQVGFQCHWKITEFSSV